MVCPSTNQTRRRLPACLPVRVPLCLQTRVERVPRAVTVLRAASGQQLFIGQAGQ